jgi:hypothetical protein
MGHLSQFATGTASPGLDQDGLPAVWWVHWAPAGEDEIGQR